jgi:sucrose-6-phosphate hydrolase SacC (GH32 family)
VIWQTNQYITYYVTCCCGGCTEVLSATSPDGFTWTDGPVGPTSTQFPQITAFDNTQLWFQDDTWFLMIECVSPHLSLFLFSSPDRVTWSLLDPGGTAMSSLNVPTGGSYQASGPWMHAHRPSVNGVYQLWYHAIDIHYATSTDMLNWTQEVVLSAPTGGGAGYEDPSVAFVGGVNYLYYTNSYEAGLPNNINLALAPDPLTCCGSESDGP